MIYLKTYCYAPHEIDFIKAQLIESRGFVDRLIVYEYDVDHRGRSKPFRLEKEINSLEDEYKSRLSYKKIEIKEYCEETDDPDIIHSLNEKVQRSYFFNDPEIKLDDRDIVFDVDVDEIVYRRSYPLMIAAQKIIRKPLSFKLNQFFYRTHFLWTDANFRSPAFYTVGAIRKKLTRLSNGLIIGHQRDLKRCAPFACGAHMSWIMSLDAMINKLKSYSHPEFEKYADVEILRQAINNKEYIFDPSRSFDIKELGLNDSRIPMYFRPEYGAQLQV